MFSPSTNLPDHPGKGLRASTFVVSTKGIDTPSTTLSGLTNAIAIVYAFLEHASILAYIDATLAAQQHQISVITKVVIPCDHLIVAPVDFILAHLFVGHQIEISAKVDTRFIERLVSRLLFEIP